MIDETLKTNLVLLQELKGNPTHKIRKRVGRGPASGSGKTCGRGYNGQKSRSGYSKRLGFEGGQMPLIRRVPKRGFTNIFKKDFKVVNLNTLNLFDAGSIVNPSLLVEKKIVKGRNPLIKILGNDEINKPLNVEAHKFSKTAKEKIEAAGGTIKVIE
ncbi:50S ribosomal protein L15 [bacterium]|nr:50S ribosomal protein L15 [bacterium]